MFGGVSLFVAQLLPEAAGAVGSARGGQAGTSFGLFREPGGRPFAFGCKHFLGGDPPSSLPRARLRPPAIHLLSFSSGGFFRCLLFVVVGFAYVLGLLALYFGLFAVSQQKSYAQRRHHFPDSTTINRSTQCITLALISNHYVVGIQPFPNMDWIHTRCV